MTLPSFNAEQSLYRSSRHYRSSWPAGRNSGIAPSKLVGMPTDTAQAMPRSGCFPGQIFNYWWGQEIYVTACGVQQLLGGTVVAQLFPGVDVAAAIAGFDIWLNANRSCDGGIYIDIPWSGAPVWVRPDC